ncbi:caspase family protein [Polyangium aurulentum]|uniref:caspase family protein n=1 Tax=Polyangium aurulentum TaxID=2567896 RepID=UPI0010ADF242|nr:caspase family protein [Polyangium aurulentum]UQA57590.1 caspase family protein [Polyangium aurulentum]
MTTLALFLGACSSAPPPVATPPVAACLTFYLQDDRSPGDAYDRDVQKAVRDATVTELVQAGFSVVRDGSAPHDLVARLEVAPGSRVESGARVKSTLVLEGGGEPIDRLEVSTPQEDPSFAPQAAGEMVDGIFRSPRLAGYIRKVRRPESKSQLALTVERQRAAEKASAAPAKEAPPPPPPPPPPPAPAELVTGAPQPGAYALVVGVEKYQHAPAVPGARGDAQRFARMVTQSFGVPADHVRMALDDRADRLGIDLQIEWLARNAPKDARIYFYYSGRGAPILGFPHLLPHDGDPKSLGSSALPVWSVLKKLGDIGAKEVVAVLDTCFSGSGGRSTPGADGAPARVVRDASVAPRVLLLSAVRGAEITHTGPEGGGLFTHWLVEAVGKGRADVDGDGRISLQEIGAWAAPRVARDAARSGGSQTPILLGGPGASRPEAFYVLSGLPTP